MYLTRYYQLYQVINKSNEQNKQFILDPLCCIVRMILLIYKPENTKISISNNSLSYSEPGWYQGVVRYWEGDKREDLHNLYYPFIKAFQWYPSNDEKFTYFYTQCAKGLDKLISSYDTTSIIHPTLKHYKKIFQDIIHKKEIDNIEEIESPLIDSLKDFWKPKEIKIVYQMLNYLDQTTDKEEKNTYLKLIDDLLATKEKKVYNYIQKYSSSYC